MSSNIENIEKIKKALHLSYYFNIVVNSFTRDKIDLSFLSLNEKSNVVTTRWNYTGEKANEIYNTVDNIK